MTREEILKIVDMAFTANNAQNDVEIHVTYGIYDHRENYTEVTVFAQRDGEHKIIDKYWEQDFDGCANLIKKYGGESNDAV